MSASSKTPSHCQCASFRCAPEPCNVGIEHLHAKHGPAQLEVNYNGLHACRVNVSSSNHQTGEFIRISSSPSFHRSESHSAFEIRLGSSYSTETF
jgi:hypothetical protein